MEPISKEQPPIPLWINGKKFEELIDTGNDILIFFPIMILTSHCSLQNTLVEPKE